MSDEEEHSESEFYYPDELEFQDNNNFTETTNELARDKTKETVKKRSLIFFFTYWLWSLKAGSH